MNRRGREETRLLEKALRDPAELRRKLVLAIALAPPKSRPPKPGPRRGQPPRS